MPQNASRHRTLYIVYVLHLIENRKKQNLTTAFNLIKCKS